MGEAAALVAAFAWSATSVAMARLTVTVSPVALSALRLMFASLVMPVILLISGQAPDLAEAPAVAIVAMVGSGIVGYAIGDTLYLGALVRVGIQQTFTITMALFIVLTVAGGIVLLGETFTWTQVVGAVLVALGIYCIVVPRQPKTPVEPAGLDLGPVRSLLPGYVLIVLAGVFWAAATLWLADGRDELGSISASSLRTPAGAAGMLAFGLATAPRDLVRPFRNRRTIGGIVAVAMVGTLFGSVLYVYAVGEAGPGKASILNACSPLLMLPLSVMFLKEKITRIVLIGTVICVAGIILVVA